MKTLSSLAFMASLATIAVEAGEVIARAPAPTPAPAEVIVGAKLGKRAVGSDTCGWISGSISNSATCSSGFQCATNAFYDAFGCCSGLLETCTLPTTCLDSTAFASLSAVPNLFTHICIVPGQEYCQTFSFDGGYSGYGCGPSNTVFPVATAVGGDKAGGVLSSIQLTGSTVPATAATATAGVAPVQTVFENNNGSSGGSSGGGLSTGAIVGIAIAGAVVAIAAIVVIGFICYKRNKRSKASVVSQPQYPPSQQPPPSSNWNHMSQAPTSHTAGGSQSPQEMHAGSQVGGASAVSQPMTQANMDSMLAQHENPNKQEWAFMQKPVAQTQTAAAAYDGIKPTEIMPEEAVDEPRPAQQMGQQQMFPQQQQQQPFTGATAGGGHFAPPQHPGSPTPTQMSTQHPGQQQGLQQQQGQFRPTQPHDVMSTMAPTAMAPTTISHNVQNV